MATIASASNFFLPSSFQSGQLHDFVGPLFHRILITANHDE
jgi:hypothetical protein